MALRREVYRKALQLAVLVSNQHSIRSSGHVHAATIRLALVPRTGLFFGPAGTRVKRRRAAAPPFSSSQPDDQDHQRVLLWLQGAAGR